MKKSGEETITENVFNSFDMLKASLRSGESHNEPEILYKEYYKQAA